MTHPQLSADTPHVSDDRHAWRIRMSHARDDDGDAMSCGEDTNGWLKSLSTSCQTDRPIHRSEVNSKPRTRDDAFECDHELLARAIHIRIVGATEWTDDRSRIVGFVRLVGALLPREVGRVVHAGLRGTIGICGLVLVVRIA
jgi:hypothetical protein